MTEYLKFMSTTITVSIVFYKGEGTIRDRLIRLWTKSPYSHTEFGRSDGLFHSNDRFSLLSRIERLDIRPEEWESIEIDLPSEIVERVEKRQIRKSGTSYDWTGIFFSQFFRLGIHNPNRWFCSKSNADDLHYAYRLMYRCGNKRYVSYLKRLESITHHPAHYYSPAELYRALKI